MGQLTTLATIVDLAASLPERNPLREELHNAATRALEEAVTDLGEGVELRMITASIKPGT